MSKRPQFRSLALAAVSAVIVLSVAPEIRAEPQATVVTNAPEKAPLAGVLPGKGPVQKGDWFDKVWGERRADFRKNAAVDQGAIVFLGDSITQGWGDPGKHFPKYRCANRGIGGDTTRGILYRCDCFGSVIQRLPEKHSSTHHRRAFRNFTTAPVVHGGRWRDEQRGWLRVARVVDHVLVELSRFRGRWLATGADES